MEHVLPHTFEEDLGSLIVWDHDNCLATVAAFNAAIAAGAVPPTWLQQVVADGHNMTLPGLQATILSHVQERAAGGGEIVGNALIAPNTIVEYARVFTGFFHMGLEPFFIAHAVCPIGRHYTLADRRTNTTAIVPISTPSGGGRGVPVFD